MTRIFQLKRKIEEFQIEGLDGVTREYRLTEMDGQQREEYNANSMNAVTVKDGKVVGMKNVKGSSVSLLGICLRQIKRLVPEMGGDAVEQLSEVPTADLLTWNTTTLEDINKLARKLNGLLTDDELKKETELAKAAGEQEPEKNG